MTGTLTVSVIEDDAEARRKLAELLSRKARLRVVGCYETGEDALREIPVQPPDVLLVDINLPGMSGIECVRALKARLPRLQVLMLTTYEEVDLIFDSLRAGAAGYLLKKEVPEQILQAVEQVHEGGSPMTMAIARKVVEHFQAAPPAADIQTLTPREEEILRLLARGSFYKEIADELSISIHTVRAHIRHIYEKLHVQSRTEAVVKFLEGEPPSKSGRHER